MDCARQIFAKNLQTLLIEKNVDQSDLAKHIGVSNASVSYWLNGEKYPRIDKIQKIADFFNVPKSYLTEDNILNMLDNHPFTMKVPIVGYKIDEQFEEYNLSFIETVPQQNLFYLQIQNRSMEPTIPYGTFVLIKKVEQVAYGDIVALRNNHNSDIVLMRIRHQEENTMFLVPDNPTFNSMTIRKNEEVEIIGKVLSYTVVL